MDPVIIKAAKKAGDFILKSLPYHHEIPVFQKAHNDFVTQVDRRVEQLIIEQIQKNYPDDGILAEESGLLNEKNTERVWIIDPLDGTRNFVQGIPHYAVSIALRIQGVIEQGVVYDPFKQELFTVLKGHGSQLNSKKIRVADAKQLGSAVIGFGFPFRHAEDVREQFFKELACLTPLCADVRRLGSAALDLAYVAAGRLDGFFEHGLELWDIAAGSLLVSEAGGLVGDLQGGEAHLSTGNIVAGNPSIFKALIQGIGKAV